MEVYVRQLKERGVSSVGHSIGPKWRQKEAACLGRSWCGSGSALLGRREAWGGQHHSRSEQGATRRLTGPSVLQCLSAEPLRALTKEVP